MSLCPHCKQYVHRQDDRVCGICGTSLSLFGIPPDQHYIPVELGSGDGDEGTGVVEVSLPLRNDGCVPLEVTFSKLDHCLVLPPEDRVVVIEPEGTTQLIVGLQAGKMNLQKRPMAHARYRTTSRETPRGEFVVYMPRLSTEVTPGEIDHSLGQMDTSLPEQLRYVSFGIALSNDGGTPLDLEFFRQRDEAQIRVEFDEGETGFIPPYAQDVEIHFRAWTLLESSPGTPLVENVRLRVNRRIADPNAENIKDIILALAAEASMPPRISVVPVRFGELLRGQSRLRYMEVRNTGGRPCTVTKIGTATGGPIVLTGLPVAIKPGASRPFELLLNTRRPGGSGGLSEETRKGNIRLFFREHGLAAVDVPWDASLVEPEGKGGLMALDFGTANSCVAFHPGGDGSPQLVHNREKKSIIPSLLLFLSERNDCFLYGTDAQDRFEDDGRRAEGMVQCVKRAIDREAGEDSGPLWQIYGVEHDGVELAALMIEQLLLESVLCCNRQPERLAMTVPAAFWGPKRERLIEAGTRASLAAFGEDLPIILVDEPTAVAMHYLESLLRRDASLEEGKAHHLLVFDFGGGTLDISVVRVVLEKSYAEIRPLVARGDNHLGGMDIDIMIVREMADRTAKDFAAFEKEAITLLKPEFQLEYSRDSGRGQFITARGTWYHSGRQAKEGLSKSSTAEFAHTTHGGIKYRPRILDANAQVLENDDGTTAVVNDSLSEAQFRDMLTGKVRRAQELVGVTLGCADLKQEDIDTVLITGQSSRIQAIREAIEEMFPGRIAAPEDCPLKESVALGAAWAAELLARNLDESGFRVQPMDHTSYRYGFEDTRLGKREFVEVIGAGIPYELARGTKKLSMGNKKATGFLISIVQNGTAKNEYSPHRERDVEHLGELDIREYKDLDEIEVTLEFQTNERLGALINGEPVKILPAPSEQETIYL
jgi:molecular chaperone DnaK (HSP70)